MSTFLRRSFSIFGLSGAGVVVVCSLITALFYRGTAGESYSIQNHFISELGEGGVSPLAWLFNFGLILGGLLFLPFAVGLALSIPGWLSKVARISGTVSALSLSAVGIFPMNNIGPHIQAAMMYFRSGLVTVFLFGLAIQLQRGDQTAVHKWANIASVIAALCYGAFLFYPNNVGSQNGSSLDVSLASIRPEVWTIAILEWSVFFGTILWFFVIALARVHDKK
jgi:hypothetical membrane protein